MEQRKKTFGRIVELPCLDPPRGGVLEQNCRSRIQTIRRGGKRKVRQLKWISSLNYRVRILSPVGESRVGGKENKGRVSEASVNRVRMRNVSS